MKTFEFENFRFEEQEEVVRFIFLENFYFEVKREELGRVGKFKINQKSITFDVNEKKAGRFIHIIDNGFQNLKNKINSNDTIYIHQNSGIPLIGCLYFGIVDKGSEMIEVKPITGCNLNCIFCSVSEGVSSKKCRDIVVEKDYIVKEVEKLVKFKKEKVDVFINPHGEPLLYHDIIGLVKDLRKIELVKNISIITNALLLDKEKADLLIKAGMNQINISINSLEQKNAMKIMGLKQYDVKKIISMIDYLKDKIKVIIAPVLMKGINEQDIEDLIVFAKQKKIDILIQNFQKNKQGRNPVKELSWDEFYKIIKDYEKKYDTLLINEDYKPKKTKEYDKPFKKNDKIMAKIMSHGREKNEKIAVSDERVIITRTNAEIGKEVRLEITKCGHNVFFGKVI